MTTEEKLLHFQESTLTSARQESSRTLQDYRSALEKEFQAHCQESHRKANLQIQTEHDRLKRENNKKLSLKRLEIRRMVSQKQKELTDKLFVEIKNDLEEYMNTPEYEALLIQEIQQAVAFAKGADLIVYLDPADSDLQASLTAATGCTTRLSSYSFMGGMRAVIPSRKILIDHSFETKLAQARESFVLEDEINSCRKGENHGA